MNFRQIEKLLESYFKGETSLSDEKALRAFFTQEDIPDHLKSLKSQFEYFSAEHENNELDSSFDDKIIDMIQKNEAGQKKFLRKRNLYMLSGIAASILIIVSIFFDLNPFPSKIKNTLNDPQVAYEETMKALIYVTQKLNNGIEPTNKLAAYEEGVKKMEKIASFDKGLNEVKKISTFHETKQRILNN